MLYKTHILDSYLVKLLQSGAIGVMPTDTIYGLSCTAYSQHSVNKIYELKKRAKNKSLVVLSSIDDLTKLVKKDDIQAVIKYWPSPLTLILKSVAPKYLNSEDGTIAIRVPDSNLIQTVLGQTGPLISTSANLSGDTPVKSISEAETVFGDKVDFYVDGGVLDGPPSTIAKLSNRELFVIRQGAYKFPKK